MAPAQHKLQVVLAAGASFFAGIYYNKRKSSHAASSISIKPGMPVFGTVSAASAAVLSPAITEPAVPIIKENTSLVPAEPPKGLSRVAEIMRFGFPGFDNIRSRRDYVMSYDSRNRTAHWVFEHLTKESVKRNDQVDRTKSDFKEDTSIHPFFRSTNADYKHSGFDRGHLAAAANHRLNQDLCDETFYMSNMSPQVGVGFNRDKWEHLERYVRSSTKIYRNVYVCTGPLYLPKQDQDNGKNYVKYQVIGKNNVAVPTHFFKVMIGELDNQQLEMEAYVLPNQAIPDEVAIATFQVPPDAVERASGLLFFDKVSRDKLSKINGHRVQ